MRLLLLFAVLLLAGCPTGDKAGKTNGQSQPPSAPTFSVSLLRTDLGLGDGELVRDADAALADLAQAGHFEYTTVGSRPAVLQTEGGAGDIGLPLENPGPGAETTGTMTTAQAQQLVTQLSDSDITIVSGPLTARMTLDRIKVGELKTKALILLDGEGPPLTDVDGIGIPIFTLDYDIREAAYLLGVAAGSSSRSQAFVCFTSEYDPNADVLVETLEKGIRHYMQGGNVYHARLTPNADNMIQPEQFKQQLVELLTGLQTDHYIVMTGRSTPSIMYALSSAPTNGYVLGGYGDFRQVRPARIVSCIVKRPGVALRALLVDKDSAPSVVSAAQAKDALTLDLRNGGVDLTDLSAYKSFNPDADDIADAVAQVRAEIEAGDLKTTE